MAQRGASKGLAFGLVWLVIVIALGVAGGTTAARPPGGTTPDGPMTVWTGEVTAEIEFDDHDPITYTHLLSPSDNAVFVHNGVEYRINFLFLQEEEITGFRQIIIEVDIPLPKVLTLQVGEFQFHVSDARILGRKRNIHAWVLDLSLIFADGQSTEVSLLEL